jgi:hypothetical protein
VVLAFRSSFPRLPALEVIRDAITACALHGTSPAK